MNINLNSEELQPILAVGIDSEKSTFNNMLFRVEEFEEGIISFLTIKQIEYLFKDAVPFITEDEYKYFTKNSNPLMYLIYDIDEVSVFLVSSEPIQRVEDYEKREKKILQCAKCDFSII